MRWLVSIAVVLALVAGLWWAEQQRQAELAPKPDVNVPAEPEEPEPRYPLPEPERQPASTIDEPVDDKNRPEPKERPEAQPQPQPPLPDLAESDEPAREALSGLLGERFVEQWLKPDFIIPRAVAIANSLDGSAPALKTWPLNPLDSEPLTDDVEGGETLLWRAENAERYAEAIDTLESVPPERAATIYGRYYSLFQRAWDELGEPEPYFNDRLIDVIDHLLATPEVELPFEVVAYEGRLHFADDQRQESSWGRKLLMRMGAEQAGLVKEWLRSFRNAILQASESPES